MTTLERKQIYYHAEIIESVHRQDCGICQTALFLMKDIVKTISEEIIT